MAEATIPVDLFNPGQVFACIGLVEAADVLLGNARGRFSWEEDAHFTLSADGADDPVGEVLDFLRVCSVRAISPVPGLPLPYNPTKVDDNSKKTKPRGEAEYAVSLRHDDNEIIVHSWLDLPGCEELKLFAGRQNATDIYRKLLLGSGKSGKGGFRHLIEGALKTIQHDPLNAVAIQPSRFGYDANGGQDAGRAGFSLDEQEIPTLCSHVVEILAPIGLNHTRPERLNTYQFRYHVVACDLVPSLLRVSLFGALPDVAPNRTFVSHLGNDKYYKKVFFAFEETRT